MTKKYFVTSRFAVCLVKSNHWKYLIWSNLHFVLRYRHRHKKGLRDITFPYSVRGSQKFCESKHAPN